MFKPKNIKTIAEQMINNWRSSNKLFRKVRFSINMVKSERCKDSVGRVLGPLILNAWYNPIRARQFIRDIDINLFRFATPARWAKI